MQSNQLYEAVRFLVVTSLFNHIFIGLATSTVNSYRILTSWVLLSLSQESYNYHSSIFPPYIWAQNIFSNDTNVSLLLGQKSTILYLYMGLISVIFPQFYHISSQLYCTFLWMLFDNPKSPSAGTCWCVCLGIWLPCCWKGGHANHLRYVFFF